MLARTAENLYWTGRYVERGDFLARLVESTLRLAGMGPGFGGAVEGAWASALAASSAGQAFAARYPTLSWEAALHFLTLDPGNGSSLRTCFERARGNAREVRAALSLETWEALNDAWHAVDGFGVEALSSPAVSDLIHAARRAVMIVDGSILRTMLRGDAYWFLQLGGAVERADNTARLLDQKYHVTLPDEEPVGGGLDYFQWSAVLRTLSALPTYHLVYGDAVKPWLVAELLIFNEQIPRSLAACYRDALISLDHLAPAAARSRIASRTAAATAERLKGLGIDAVFASGLHEFLSQFVVENNHLGAAVAEQFLFQTLTAEKVPT